MKKIITIILALVLFSVIGTVIFIHTRPVDFDTGACSGGYATYIFNKYNKDLTQTYLNDKRIYKESVRDVEILADSQSVIWEGKNIFIKYDIKYKLPKDGEITETVKFTGKRIWIDTFKWTKN